MSFLPFGLCLWAVSGLGGGVYALLFWYNRSNNLGWCLGYPFWMVGCLIWLLSRCFWLLSLWLAKSLMVLNAGVLGLLWWLTRPRHREIGLKLYSWLLWAVISLVLALRRCHLWAITAGLREPVVMMP